MSKMARNKGQSGERECLRWFEAKFGLPRLSRNHSQTESGGADCLELPGIALEVKRQETLHLDMWWKQAVDQAVTAQRMPVLAYRQNRKQWQFCIPASLVTTGSWGYLHLTEKEFILWYSSKLCTEFN